MINNTRILIIADETHAVESRAAGTAGLLLRNAQVKQLVTALQAVMQGLLVVDPVLAETFLPAVETAFPALLIEALTPRELELVRLLAEGLSNKAIARRLDISDHTVKFHVNAIMGKLEAQSRTEAVVRATRLGLIML